jgi:hypothetical protein
MMMHGASVRDDDKKIMIINRTRMGVDATAWRM